MRAIVLEKQGKVESSPLHIKEIAKPHPGRNEICVKVNTCGICRTDLHIVEGDLKLRRSPIVPGHQIVGSVSDVGYGVKGFRQGDRAGVTWINSTCGKCKFCKSGMENLCDGMRFTGWDVNGGYAEYMIVRQDFAYPLPSNFDDAHAAPLLCAGIIGYRGFKLSGAKPGQTLHIFGFGASAHIITQVARHFGCRVIVSTRSGLHRAMARRLGAAISVGTSSIKADAAIITAPSGALVLDALSALDKGGRVAVIDIHMSRIPEIDYDAKLYGERSITSVTNYTRADVKEFLKLAAAIPIKTTVQEFKLEEANKALTLMKQSRIDAAGVIRI
ncbi:MAG: zinc-dependent alcohol dehydrogenase family protein [Candidatus Marsarchaeota archaeon]|jgi:propanol-preferring alcohol dehydrogenase|nr:zinc-dependent alcohol dehydrogenase family protein [Candidatus Marsarchaeota archaeon]MCL5111885.1 zinc-dependent alcohol dehydrogenase family protein [Candidatus Marsarchaeota archaeon]